jgi:hypothetical protein
MKKYLKNYDRFDEYDTEREAYKALISLDEERRPLFLDATDKEVIAYLKTIEPSKSGTTK